MQPQPTRHGRRLAVAPAPSWADEANGFMANFYRGTGIGDEAVAGLNTGLDLIARPQARADPIAAYKAKLAEQRRYEDAFRARHPVAVGGAQLAGLGATMLVPLAGEANLARAAVGGGMAANAARGALAAASADQADHSR